MLQGSVAQLLLKPLPRSKMRVRPSVDLELRCGIIGDCHARPLGPRQVLIAQQEALDELGVDAHQVRANIAVAGMSRELLSSGRVLQFESGPLVRLTHACEVCSALRGYVHQETFRVMPGRRGVLGVVLRGGRISVGDEVGVDLETNFPLVPETLGDRVQWVLRQLPVGRVTTYGKVVELVGGKRAHLRALPAYLRRAEAAGLQTHRILTSAGGMTGHVRNQAPRLLDEGIPLTSSRTLADPRRLWSGEDLYFRMLEEPSDFTDAAALTA